MDEGEGEGSPGAIRLPEVPEGAEPAAAARFGKECEAWLTAIARAASGRVESAPGLPQLALAAADGSPEDVKAEPLSAPAGPIGLDSFPLLERAAPKISVHDRVGKVKRRMRPTAVGPAAANTNLTSGDPTSLATVPMPDERAACNTALSNSLVDGTEMAPTSVELPSRLAGRLAAPLATTQMPSANPALHISIAVGMASSPSFHEVATASRTSASLSQSLQPSQSRVKLESADGSSLGASSSTGRLRQFPMDEHSSGTSDTAASAESVFSRAIRQSAQRDKVLEVVRATARLIHSGCLPLLPMLIAAIRCLLVPTPSAPTLPEQPGEIINPMRPQQRRPISNEFPRPTNSSTAGVGATPPISVPSADCTELSDACAYSALLLHRFGHALSCLSPGVPLNVLGASPRLSAAASAAQQMGWRGLEVTSQRVAKPARRPLRAPVLPSDWEAEPVSRSLGARL